MDVKRATVAGIVATAVMTVSLMWAPAAGVPKLAIGHLLSTFLAVSVALLPVSPTGAWIIHFLAGTCFALIYARFFADRLPGAPAVRGAIFGSLLFLVAQLLFMPMVGAGIFSRGDSVMILGSLAGHLVYGALVGAIYGWGRVASVSPA